MFLTTSPGARSLALMPTDPDFLSVQQAAVELALAPRTVHQRIAAGKIAARRIGDGRTSAYVITRSEVERVKAARAT